jgi:hypothetical protein
MLGDGRLNAMTGGVGRGRAATIRGRSSSVGAGGCAARFGEGGGLGGSARRTSSEPFASPSLISLGDGGRSFGSHCHNTATCMSSDSANATHIVGMVTPSRLSRELAGPSLTDYSKGIKVGGKTDGAPLPDTSIVNPGPGHGSIA